jgi:hypothetical protein
MLIRSAIFLATFGTKFHLKPTCNLEDNPTQTKDIMSKLHSFRLESHSSRRNDVTSPTMRNAEALLAAMYHVHQWRSVVKSIGMELRDERCLVFLQEEFENGMQKPCSFQCDAGWVGFVPGTKQKCSMIESKTFLERTGNVSWIGNVSWTNL